MLMSAEHLLDNSTDRVPWVEGLTIGKALEHTVARFPTFDALVFPQLKLRWSWSELKERVDQTARAIIALGLQPGDHLAVWATNIPEWVLLQFAAAQVGVVLVTINPAYRPFELEYVLKQSDAKALFLIDQFKSSNYLKMLAEVCPDIETQPPGAWQSEKFPLLKHVVTIRGTGPSGTLSWEMFLQQAESVPAPLW